ncbi:MAG: ATP-binding protein [Thermodesulfovibrio sp.]|uniref:ATP-binding protein n=1 Tax=unclassified Thermodesulfovibrio TaxID=2645936 RepID=UPI000856D323|nr:MULTISPECIES: ATP-binding protein [unclassified Thermodesulfovibrio]MDI1471615.1 ATP-binding protein [Thermodesulfovibrio sp. 1176]MDI6715150.1 ATP-binding protein [Thermodesulfovibrio sp.]ODA44730.1 sensor histidine kinase [Thermodesulfovibrio sp. N1]
MLQHLKSSVTNKFLIKIKRISIGRKIFLSFLILFIILIVAVNLLILNYQKKSLKNQINENISTVLENLSKDAIDHIVLFDPLAIDEKITLIMNNPGIEYIMIADKNGRIIGHSSKKELGNSIKFDKNTLKKWQYVDHEGIWHLNIPIMAGDTFIGVLRSGISENKIDQHITEVTKNLKNYIFILSLLAFGVTVFMSFMLSKTLIKPLQRLKNKMSHIQADRLEICQNPSIVLCKDILSCNKTECPAYGKERCWLIREAKENCKQCHSIDCNDCYVYKISCGDEIGYLIETFNEMILKLKNSLEELDKATKEKLRLEKSSAMAEMAMTVAHEIKNPLNAIKASTAYIKSNFEGEVLKEFLSIIDKETERLNELITSFLSYARPIPLKYEKANVNKSLTEVIKLIETEVKEDGKILKTEFDEKIPEFYFDNHQLKQAILNLLVNAMDATNRGDTISITTSKKDSKVLIKISDTGTGIPDELLNKIFEPFFTTKTTGSGLGLACVERIIKDHDGNIIVNSKKGVGTEFIIELPLKL